MATSGIFFTALSFILLVKANPVDSRISIPKECADKNICDVKPVNYPYKLFDKLLESMQHKDFMMTQQYQGELGETTNMDDENCSTRETIIQPFIVKSNMSTTARLVIQTKYYEQRVKQTECLGHRDPCFQSVISGGYTGTCTPTDGTMYLYVYNPKSPELIEHMAVSFPMCCSCSIKSTI